MECDLFQEKKIYLLRFEEGKVIKAESLVLSSASVGNMSSFNWVNQTKYLVH